MISVGQFRAFVAVVEVGTATRAAEVIGRTQPQVSRLVTELEEEVGFPLFLRDGRRLVLTQRGTRLYDEVKNALDAFDRVRSSATCIRNDAETELRILAPPYIAHTFLPLVLAEFRKTFSHRRFSIEIVTRNVTGSWLPHHSFDIGIAALPIDLPTVRIRRFGSMETVVVLPMDHHLRTKAVLSLADLEPYPFIALNRNTAMRKRLNAIFERHGFSPNIVGTTANSSSAYEMVAAGIGWSIVTSLTPLALDLPTATIRAWKPGATTEFCFFYPSSGSVPPAAEDFMDIFKKVFDDFALKAANVT